ncbi:MAG: helix-turn-helix transcriptional regulator [Candidatus Eisenbacteria bacterium]
MIRDVSELAAALGVSREHLSRSFRKQFGCSVWQYIGALRVERAKRLLHEPILVKEASREVGFRSDGTLLRAFRKHAGMSPSRYRRLAQLGLTREAFAEASQPDRPGLEDSHLSTDRRRPKGE